MQQKCYLLRIWGQSAAVWAHSLPTKSRKGLAYGTGTVHASVVHDITVAGCHMPNSSAHSVFCYFETWNFNKVDHKLNWETALCLFFLFHDCQQGLKKKLCEENLSVQGECVAGAFESLCLNFLRGRYTSCLTCTGKSDGKIWQSKASCVAFGRDSSHTGSLPNSKHWFTTSFLQPLLYLVTP